MTVMIEALEIESSHRILEIGTGTGYNAGVMATMLDSPGHVVSAEIHPQLAASAKQALRRIGLGGTNVIIADGGLQVTADGSIDRLLATAGVAIVPPAWWRELSGTGKIVLCLQGRLAGAIVALRRITARQAAGTFLPVSDVGFIPILGSYGVTAPMSRSVPPAGLRWACGRLPIDLAQSSALRFLLQTVLPMASLSQWRSNQDELHLVLRDGITGRQLHFPPAESVVDLAGNGWAQGDSDLWDTVRRIYRRWLSAGRPVLAAYALRMDISSGQISLALNS